MKIWNYEIMMRIRKDRRMLEKVRLWLMKRQREKSGWWGIAELSHSGSNIFLLPIGIPPQEFQPRQQELVRSIQKFYQSPQAVYSQYLTGLQGEAVYKELDWFQSTHFRNEDKSSVERSQLLHRWLKPRGALQWFDYDVCLSPEDAAWFHSEAE